MRMWMVDPRYMCREHLLGEHVETHMFCGHILKGRKVEGFINNNLLEPFSLKERHDFLAAEIIKRGYNHKSDFSKDDHFKLKDILNIHHYENEVDRQISLNELLSRCVKCEKNFKFWKGIENVKH